MNELLFKIRTLIIAINLLKPAPSEILDRVFGLKKPSLTDLISWEMLITSERILKNLRVNEPAHMADNQGRKVITCAAPRFAQQRFISAADLSAMRALGSERETELLKNRINNELVDMKRQIDTTREYMAAKALQGQIVNESGEVLVDFNFDASQKPVLAGANLWTDIANSDPLSNIDAWKTQISDEVGNVQSWIAFVGSNAYKAMKRHPDIKEMLKFAAGLATLTSGKLPEVEEVELVSYKGSYVDQNEVRQRFVPADQFILVGITGDQAAEIAAPVVDLEAEAGVGSGKPGEFFFAKSWKQEEPSGRNLKVEARPLPVLIRPGCVIAAKVV